MVELRKKNPATGKFERVGRFDTDEQAWSSLLSTRETATYEVVSVPALSAGGPSRTMPEDGTGDPDYVPPPEK